MRECWKPCENTETMIIFVSDPGASSGLNLSIDDASLQMLWNLCARCVSFLAGWFLDYTRCKCGVAIIHGSVAAPAEVLGRAAHPRHRALPRDSMCMPRRGRTTVRQHPWPILRCHTCLKHSWHMLLGHPSAAPVVLTISAHELHLLNMHSSLIVRNHETNWWAVLGGIDWLFLFVFHFREWSVVITCKVPWDTQIEFQTTFHMLFQTAHAFCLRSFVDFYFANCAFAHLSLSCFHVWKCLENACCLWWFILVELVVWMKECHRRRDWLL